MKREFTMYSKGVTEILILEAADLKVLRFFNYNLPADYLLTLDIFKTYPLDILLKKYNDAIVYKYFGYRHFKTQLYIEKFKR